jgi:hypothetical protein
MCLSFHTPSCVRVSLLLGRDPEHRIGYPWWFNLYAGLFVGKNLKETDHSDSLGTDGRIILKMDPKETGCERLDLIHLTQKRQQWLAVVSTVMNIRFQ